MIAIIVMSGNNYALFCQCGVLELGAGTHSVDSWSANTYLFHNLILVRKDSG